MDLIQKVERCIHKTKVKIVSWKRPSDQWVKINSDGSALNNPKRTRVGVIIRDVDGRMILAYVVPLRLRLNKQAELEAEHLQLGYNNIALEMNSQQAVN